MVDESIIGIIKNYLRKVQDSGITVSFGVVFGSQTTGKTDKWSDIDLLVVSPRFDAPKTRRDIDLLWKLTPQVDSRIEPIPCGERQWEEDDASTIIEIARRMGDMIKVQE
ncbi:MAG: nucleotidyltransferase domain-containing protein [Firmicutes bacterium]|nr:nucleotidyltransferase domain-containing protein [Bacillota bacterium]